MSLNVSSQRVSFKLKFFTGRTPPFSSTERHLPVVKAAEEALPKAIPRQYIYGKLYGVIFLFKLHWRTCFPNLDANLFLILIEI